MSDFLGSSWKNIGGYERTPIGNYTRFPYIVSENINSGGGVAGVGGVGGAGVTTVSVDNSNTSYTMYPVFVSGTGTQLRLLANTGSSPISFSPGNGDINVVDTLKVGQTTVAIGKQTGNISQQSFAIAIGFNAGNMSQQSYAIAIGALAGYTGQQSNAIAIGNSAGATSQQGYAIAIGNSAGATGQQSNAIAIGNSAGNSGQQSNAIAIGNSAGATGQQSNAIAIGNSAGATSQQGNAIAIGKSAGQTGQGANSVAIGIVAGNSGQGQNAVAIGNRAGQDGQQESSVAIGWAAGETMQGVNSVAIGIAAGQFKQGSYAVAIGFNAGAIGQPNNSNVLNASAAALNPANFGFFVKPIRAATNTPGNSLVYNRDDGELQYLTNTSVFFNGLYTRNIHFVLADLIKNQIKTVECWFKTSTTPGIFGNFVALYTTLVNDFMFNVGINSSGKVEFNLSHDSTGSANSYTTITSDSVYTDNKWHHVSASFNFSASPPALHLHIDGTVTKSKPTTLNLNTVRINLDKYLVFGNDSGSARNTTTDSYNPYDGRYFTGYLSDVRIWNKYRALSDVQSDYTTRLKGTETGLLGYWKLDDNPSATDIPNASAFKDSTTNFTHSKGANVSIVNDGIFKTFVIDHPIHPNKYLVHACLEGPESGVYYRGKGEIVNGTSVEVQLPAYVGALCPGADFTVQLTPIYDGTIRASMLYASEVDPATNSFRVYGENGRFNWLVHGKRFDIEVEPNKADVNKHGDGPYTYLSKKIGL